ncbi:MAG: efflux transporter outer membrane subunit [Paracoccaceae bacterium]|nr:efflux transporter outer membrane subunit [Paracoccaceae bacterium]
MKPFFVMALALVASGCAVVGPDYKAPDLAAPAGFVGGGTTPLQDAALEKWWTKFNDPILNTLVDEGLSKNLNIKIALARIEAARATAERFGPASQVAGDVSVNAELQNVGGVRTERSSAQVGAAFVFDLFGETARRREAAGAALDAAEFDVGTARLAYLSELVSAYVRLRYFQTAASLTRQTIASREATLNVTRDRRGIGEATQLDVARASSLLAAERAALPLFEAEVQMNAFRIATLIDHPADTVLRRTASFGKIPSPGTTDAGLPADLLRNRPDIRAAERRLAAATAAIGVREAQLYPSLRVNGSVTAASTNAWSFGPAVVLPLTDRPGLGAEKRVAEAAAQEAELSYRASLISAVEDVQVAMVQTDTRQRQVTALVAATSSAQSAMSLATQSFEAGLVPLDAVLDAERTRLENGLELALGQAELAQAWVRQQVATGKGWAARPTD